MGFERIVGHDELKAQMQGALERGRLAHAYIFEGAGGIGKTTTAVSLAEAILCDQGGSDACGTCHSCLKFEHENHPDYMCIEPDGASIKNKQVEAFQQFILTKPYDGHAKVVVISKAETMTTSAQNRILKVLEEPPSYATILFVTENETGLLPTIRSRCQTVRFYRLPSVLIEEYLTQKLSLEETLAKQCAVFADGSLEQAINAAQSEVFQEKREKVEELADALCSRNFIKALEKAQYIEENKEDADGLLSMLIGWYRDLVFIKGGLGSGLVRNQDRLSALQQQASRIEYKEAVQAVERIERARRQLKAYVNLGLLLESLILDIQEGIK